jgi:proteasome lid subunit RPN8/RPN11
MSLMLAVALTIAYPFNDQTLARADVHACFDHLLAHAYYGRADYESAAFLVLNDDQTIVCRDWPPTFAFRAAQWSSAVPNGTIAIAHTHPAAMRRPSTVDLNTAAAVGVPIIVLTPAWVSIGATDGSVTFYQRH